MAEHEQESAPWGRSDGESEPTVEGPKSRFRHLVIVDLSTAFTEAELETFLHAHFPIWNHAQRRMAYAFPSTVQRKAQPTDEEWRSFLANDLAEDLEFGRRFERRREILVLLPPSIDPILRERIEQLRAELAADVQFEVVFTMKTDQGVQLKHTDGTDYPLPRALTERALEVVGYDSVPELADEEDLAG